MRFSYCSLNSSIQIVYTPYPDCAALGLIVTNSFECRDTETALSLWATLQTFLHDRNNESKEWFSKLWVLVPYDPTRIRQLWNEQEK